MAIRRQLPFSRTLRQGVGFEDAIAVVAQIPIDKFPLQNHEATIDITSGGLRLFRKTGDVSALQPDLAETAGGMNRRDGSELAAVTMEIEQRRNIHGAQTLALCKQ